MRNTGASGRARRRILRGPTPETHPKKTTPPRQSQTAKQPRNVAKASPSSQPPSIPRPGGKLGIIIDRLAAKAGATADELVAATGRQRHSVLGALS